MPIKNIYFVASIAIALLLCVTQIIGDTMLILLCLIAFLGLVGWACSQNYTLPILLFFLPWSPLLRTDPNSFSFYTFGLVLVCVISVFKKKFRFKKYHIAVGILLVFISLFSKLIDGSSITFDYIAFMMLILLFPVVKEEWTSFKYDFFGALVFLSSGIILAALCAQQFATYPNISEYIVVHSYLTITRMSGFYGDPNFYTAQITAALGGGLVAILKETTKPRTISLAILLFLLLYCGFLSGSKSFVIISALIIFLWIIELLRMRKRSGLKVILIIGGSLIALFIASSTMFSSLIDVLVTRFSSAEDLSGFTTGRTELWRSYFEELFSDGKLLLFGKGFTNVKVNDRGSHNTILQIVFQFGLLGAPLLIAWIAGFFRDLPGKNRYRNNQTINVLILLIGSFMPWLAIDALFFDEFFLLQWYTFVGWQQLVATESISFLSSKHCESKS